MSQLSGLDLVRNTIEYYAPNSELICVGSVAINAQLAEVGLPQEPIAEVDALCSHEYMSTLLGTKIQDDDYMSFHVEKTWGALRNRGFNMKWLRIMQDPAKRPDILPFEVAESLPVMSHDNDREISYEEYIKSPGLVVEASGLRCVYIGEVLKTLAVVGRERDLDRVSRITPIAAKADLITDAEHSDIEREHSISANARVLNPHRRYARIDASTDQPVRRS